MSETFLTDIQFHGRLRRAAPGLVWLGVVIALLGLAAILFPMLETLAATVMVGWLILIFGLFTNGNRV